MHGIVGLIMGRKQRSADEVEWIRQTFTNMMASTTAKGTATTGAFILNRKGIDYYRSTQEASAVVLEPEWWGLMDKIDSDTLAVIGHTRSEALGDGDGKLVWREGLGRAETDEDAQPFGVGEIIGVHIGSILNHEDIKTKYFGDYHGLSQVDSAAVFAAISENSKKNSASTETVAEAMSEIKGDLLGNAIVVADARRPDSVFIASDGRPLCFKRSMRRQVLLMASAEPLLDNTLPLVEKTEWLPIKTVARLTHRHGSGAAIKATRWHSNAEPFSLSVEKSVPRYRDGKGVSK
jgi:glucosamine 6-phosphate synthetase-like amidotransferase/phosphosugar isomerase protein